jgi:type IV secretion system protein VirB4
MTITAFDKGRSLYGLCAASKGRHYDIGHDESTLTLAPLSELESPSDLIWAEEWITTCVELQSGRALTPMQKAEIHRAITLLQTHPREARSLTEFVGTVQDEEIRSALTHYTISGAMGHLLDGQADSLASSVFTVFEIDELMALGEKNALPVLLYLFRRFERSLKGQPAILSLDEAWVMLGHPVFQARLRKWFKELRKSNCIVLLATQNLSDILNSGLLDVLLEQCPTKIFLPNMEADLEGTAENPGPANLYRAFGLNDREIALLKHSQSKRHYYLKSPEGRRLFELGLGPVALSFVAVSGREDVEFIRQFQHQYGESWPLAWLQHRGVDYAQYLS